MSKAALSLGWVMRKNAEHLKEFNKINMVKCYVADRHDQEALRLLPTDMQDTGNHFDARPALLDIRNLLRHGVLLRSSMVRVST